MLGSEARTHANDGLVKFGEDRASEKVVVVGLAKHCGDDVGDSPTAHDADEALGRLVEVAGECQTLFERQFGVSKDDP